MSGQPAEQCRTQQNPGQYLADNARLPATLGYHTEQRGYDKNQRDITEHVSDNYIHDNDFP